MSEELSQLPIVEELGAALTAAFRRREAARVRRPLARAGALATAAAMGAGIVLATQLGGGTLSPAKASAADLLRAAARAAAAQPARLPKPGQFYFVRWRSTVLLPIRRNAGGLLPVAFAGPRARVTIETWEAWSATRKGAIETRLRAISFPTAAARARWVALGRPPLSAGLLTGAREQVISPFGARIPLGSRVSLSARQLLALPADPDALYRRVFAGASAAQALTVVGSLAFYPVAPRLRASVFRALALVPGIRAVGSVRTLSSRVGVAFAAADPGGAVEDEIILDPRTGTVLGIRTVALPARGLAAGTVRSETVIVLRTITDTPAPPRTKR